MAFEAEKIPHEDAGVRTGRVVLFVLGFVGFVALLMVALNLFYRASVDRRALETRLREFPAPQLQPNPTQDYANFMKAQRDELTGTRWVDQGKGLIHVPIERAMAYVAGRGAAAYDPLPEDASSKPALTPADGAPRVTPAAPVAPYGATR